MPVRNPEAQQRSTENDEIKAADSKWIKRRAGDWNVLRLRPHGDWSTVVLANKNPSVGGWGGGGIYSSKYGEYLL